MILKDVTVLYKKLSIMQEEFRAERSNVKARMCRKFIAMLEFTPTIEAEPVRHGRWICQIATKSYSDYRCSECDAAVMTNSVYTIDNFHYCHRCGAKMDGKENKDAEESSEK